MTNGRDELAEIRAVLAQVAQQQAAFRTDLAETKAIVDSNARGISETRAIVDSNARAIEANNNGEG